MTFNSGLNNPRGAGTGALGQIQGGGRSGDLGKSRKHLTQGLLTAGAYALWGAADAFQYAAITGAPDTGMFDAGFRIVLVGGLAGYMFLKKSIVGAGGLVALTALNTIGLFMGWMANDPYSDLGSAILHLGFGAMFVRTGLAARAIKRAG